VGQAGVGRRRALVVLNVNRDGSGSWEREASERLHVPVIELACALNSSTFAADNHHLNAHGHAVAASGLRALVRLAWSRRRACSGPSAGSYGAQTDGATLAAADNKCTTLLRRQHGRSRSDHQRGRRKGAGARHTGGRLRLADGARDRARPDVL